MYGNDNILLILLLVVPGVHPGPADGVHAPAQTVEKQPHILYHIDGLPGGGPALALPEELLHIGLCRRHIHLLFPHFFQSRELPLLPLQPQYRPGMALGEIVLPQKRHTAFAQPQKPQLVGYRRLGPAQPAGRLLLAETILGNEPGNGGSLLHIVKIAALEVFNQGQDGAVLLGGPHQDAGHMGQPRQACRPQPPLPGHQHIASRRPLDAQRLKHAVLPNGGRQLPQGLLVKMAAGLPGIGYDLINRQLVNPPGLE